MSRICDLTGKKPISGFKVSHSNRRTRRWFAPNLQTKKIFHEELGEWVTIRVSTQALRTIDKHGLSTYLRKLHKKMK